MTPQEQVAELLDRVTKLEAYVAEIDQRTASLVRLGPQLGEPLGDYLTAVDVARIKKLAEVETLAPRQDRHFAIIEDAPPVDRSARVLTDGSEVTADHREINPNTGQQKGYVVLSAEERAKGFVRPVRMSYTHKTCGTDTVMGLPIAENWTFCAHCRAHFPSDQFVWEGTDEQVGS